MSKKAYDPNEDKETVLIDRFGLIKYSETYNRPYDALDGFNNKYEIKSTSKGPVSTARDCNINHIHKWRNVIWIVGVWNRNSSTYGDIHLLRPQEMKGWLDTMENEYNEIESIRQEILKEFRKRDDINQVMLEKMLKRSLTKNDPRIPYDYIVANGIKIETKEDLFNVVANGIIPPKGLLAFAGVDNDEL